MKSENEVVIFGKNMAYLRKTLGLSKTKMAPLTWNWCKKS